MKNGVPFDVAMSLPELERAAFAISFGEIDGGVFNFETMRWDDQK